VSSDRYPDCIARNQMRSTVLISWKDARRSLPRPELFLLTVHLRNSRPAASRKLDQLGAVRFVADAARPAIHIRTYFVNSPCLFDSASSVFPQVD
jgi:hypothetical protein